MLMIKANVRQSPIQGLGLFANEKIKKGTIIWKFNPRFDIVFDPQEVETMSKPEKDLVMRYAYLSKVLEKWVYCTDDGRFINHSVNKNVDGVLISGEPEECDIANRDIEPGEELLCDYRTFDINDAKSRKHYLKT